MREIKFRCWNVAGEKMTYDDEWCYEWSHIKHAHEAGRIILMQYTGMKDKNGVEIHEGDIVEAHSFVFDGNERDSHFTGKIVFSPDCCFAIESGSSQYAFCETSHFDEPCIKVIGNIYENPELLV